MQDIFGDVDDLLGMYAEKKATALLDETPTNDTGILSSPAAAEAMAAATGQRVHSMATVCPFRSEIATI